jgi:hypothetical protein
MNIPKDNSFVNVSKFLTLSENFLSLSNMNLKQFPTFEKDEYINIDIFYFHNNQIIEIPLLPPNLKQLSCEKNPFTQFTQLPQSLKKIWLSPWQIASYLNNTNSPQAIITIVN